MAEGEPVLLHTPTWAIACVCAVFILISLIAERTIFYVGRVAENYNRAALLAAYQKVKEELIMVGFMSIALTVGQPWFAKLCVPKGWSKVMPLCDTDVSEEESSSTETTTTCSEDHMLFMPAENVHELHILIFILALVHIVYTVVIVFLAMWVVSHWKVWEERAVAKEQLTVHGGIRHTRDVSFVRSHASNKWIRNPVLAYVVAFFQQFYGVVTETDYSTLRYGFVKSHLADNNSFDFHKYIQRSFQEDFKHVVGISPLLWAYTVLWLLVNVHGWETSIFVTLVPLLVVLAVGTKLQYIITKMAHQILDKHAVVVGLAPVKPSDSLFWFGRPRLILHLLHFILFQNALEISFDIWAAISFPAHNCLYGHPSSLVRRLVIGIAVQMVCGVITLPIYALVSQMGSSVKKTIFEEHVQQALSGWLHRARGNVKRDGVNVGLADRSRSTHSEPGDENSVRLQTEITMHRSTSSSVP